jgi:hypothetical protein
LVDKFPPDVDEAASRTARTLLLSLVYRITNPEVFQLLCNSPDIGNFIGNHDNVDPKILFTESQRAFVADDDIYTWIGQRLIDLSEKIDHLPSLFQSSPALSLSRLQREYSSEPATPKHLARIFAQCQLSLGRATCPPDGQNARPPHLFEKDKSDIQELVESLKKIDEDTKASANSNGQDQPEDKLTPDQSNLFHSLRRNAFYVHPDCDVEFLSTELFPRMFDVDPLSTLSNFRSVIVEHESGMHSFIIAPVLPHEGDSLWKRLRITLRLTEFVRAMKSRQDHGSVRLCVLSGRFELSDATRRYVRDASILRENLEIYDTKGMFRSAADGGCAVFVERRKVTETRPRGVVTETSADARQSCLAYEAESAFANADIVIPPDGNIGDLIVRTLCLSGGGPWSARSVPWFLEDNRRLPFPAGEGRFGTRTDLFDAHRKNAALWQELSSSIPPDCN